MFTGVQPEIHLYDIERSRTVLQKYADVLETDSIAVVFRAMQVDMLIQDQNHLERLLDVLQSQGGIREARWRGMRLPTKKVEKKKADLKLTPAELEELVWI